jgi:uncharacterized membrane protein YkvA (DUF1232 family)
MNPAMSKSSNMPSGADFAEFIASHAAKVTPADVYELHARLPELREQAAGVDAAGFPQAPAQFQFLADVVESFAADQLRDLPLSAVSEAAFALMYLDRAIDLIPDSVGPLGFTDDAAVAATVLLRHAPDFAATARKQGADWSRIDPAQGRAE